MKKNKFPRNISKVFERKSGALYLGDSLDLLQSKSFSNLNGKVNLIITSPPYPLNQKKSYGNKTGEEYLNWIKELTPLLAEKLADDGSLVVELGNSWEPGRPVQSLLALKALMSIAESAETNLRLIQEFVCYNPSRLPSPAQWVTVNPLRTVDSYTHVWWFSKTDYPKADNRKVLRPYSEAMKSLLKRGSYNAGKRPSEHSIGEKSFLNDRGGAISHNLFEIESIDENRKSRLPNAFSFSNSASNDFFHRECKRQNITVHPARMPIGLVKFFIQYLTDEGDLILDPFAGSNTTGFAAALLNRNWISIELQESYIEQAKIRFEDPILSYKEV